MPARKAPAATKPKPPAKPKAGTHKRVVTTGPKRRRGKRPATKEDWRVKFLREVAQGYSTTAASATAGVTRQAAYQRAKVDEAFASAWADAESAAVDVVRDEIFRRAVQGVERGVWHQGVRVGEETHYSDQLLMFEGKRRDPAYRENANVSLNMGGEVRHVHEAEMLDGKDPVQVEGPRRRAAARALLGMGDVEGTAKDVA